MCLYTELCVVQLLAEGLCVKHDLDLTDFTPHTETLPENEEGGEEGEREAEHEITTDTGIIIATRSAYTLAGFTNSNNSSVNNMIIVKFLNKIALEVECDRAFLPLF